AAATYGGATYGGATYGDTTYGATTYGAAACPNRDAAAQHRDADDPGRRLVIHHISGLAALMTGADRDGFTHLREALRLADRITDPALLITAASDGILTGRDRHAATLARRAAAAGTNGQIPAALEVVALAEFAAGRYDAATEAALDGAATAGGQATAHHALLGLLAALFGDRATVDRLRPAAELGDWAAGVLDLVEGRPDDARNRLTPLVTGGDLILRIAVTPHLIEAGAPIALAAP